MNSKVQSDPSSSDKMRAARPTTEPPSEVHPSSHSAPRRTRVLIVEDDESLGRALMRFLRGYDLVYCRNVPEALERTRSEPFDVIVTDMMMPGGNGSDLHATLVTEAPDLAARMLFMTGGATTPETLAFVAEHSRRVVHKPLDLAELRKRVAALLEELGPMPATR